MGLGSKSGLMVPSTKASGKTTKHTVTVFSGMCMVTNTKEHGRGTKLTAKVSIHIVMAPLMKVLGKMICNMVTERSSGTTNPSI